MSLIRGIRAAWAANKRYGALGVLSGSHAGIACDYKTHYGFRHEFTSLNGDFYNKNHRMEKKYVNPFVSGSCAVRDDRVGSEKTVPSEGFSVSLSSWFDYTAKNVVMGHTYDANIGVSFFWADCERSTFLRRLYHKDLRAGTGVDACHVNYAIKGQDIYFPYPTRFGVVNSQN